MLSFHVDSGGHNWAETYWHDKCLIRDRSAIRSPGRRANRGLSVAECFDGTPVVQVIEKKPPALTWLVVEDVVLVIGKLRKTIEQYSGGFVEFIPVETFLCTDKRDKGVRWPEDDQFFVMNPLDVVDCIDEERSEFGDKKVINNRSVYRDIKFLYIVDDNVKNKSICRIFGIESIILMTQSLVNDLESAGSLGASWIPTEEIFRPPAIFPQLWEGKRPKSRKS